MGLGGWMFDGIERLTMLGASGDPEVPGLGFRYDEDPRWAMPNPTGLEGVFEAFCPPHFPDMRAAVEALAERKFGPGGVYNPETPGAWSESDRIRGAAQPYTEEFKACVAHQAQYIFDTFGRFPGSVPTLFIMNYVQAQHLDTEFYDRFFRPGAYLATHAEHMRAGTRDAAAPGPDELDRRRRRARGRARDAQHPPYLTGVTVVLARAGAVGGVDVRGGGPGTRETDVLDPRNLVDRVHAVLLTGGSAYGLAAATGVMSALEDRGIGFPVGPSATRSSRSCRRPCCTTSAAAATSAPAPTRRSASRPSRRLGRAARAGQRRRRHRRGRRRAQGRHRHGLDGARAVPSSARSSR